jgi:queuine/archaeosine tRNA-ribosyltransferase
LAFYLDTMRGIRQAIRLGDFAEFRADFIKRMQHGNAA